MSELSVYCPKNGEWVPVWHCLGSFVREKEACPEPISAEVGEDKAVVSAGWRRKKAWKNLR